MESVLSTIAIHIELDALCALILCAIAYQSAHNVSQQMNRVLFRNLVYGIIGILVLDILWLLVDGKPFVGGTLINGMINALFLAMGVALGCVWYLYVLETMGYHINQRLTLIVMLPAAIFLALDLLSISTGWIFSITPENVYVHGPLFLLQQVGAYGMLFVSLVHIVAWLISGRGRANRREMLKLLGFFIIPVIGSIATMPYMGMPGAWTCAAVSIVLIYIDDQDQEILRDSLTGLNNRKTLDAAFADYARQITPEKELYLFMMDLDDFKRINDTLGHPVGDQALVAAARVLTRSVSGIRAIIARFGGDEFLVMGFFDGDSAARYFKKTIAQNLEEYNETEKPPFRLAMSVGFARYEPGQSLQAFIESADEKLYAEKARRKVGR